MKLLLIALLGITATAESRRCEPHSTWNEYCNGCVCSANGEDIQCTLEGCIEGMYNKDGTLKDTPTQRSKPYNFEQVCRPYSTSKYYCNSCICSADGKHNYCTKLPCDYRIYNEDGTLKSLPTQRYNFEQVCRPYSSSMNYCNACICSPDGKYNICTQEACDYRRYNKDGTLKSFTTERPRAYRSEQVCVPHSTSTDYCNSCTCSEDGKSSICTRLPYCGYNRLYKRAALPNPLVSNNQDST